MITILKHPQHRGIKILEDKLTFFVLTDLVQVINQQPLQQLIHKSLHLITRHLLHDFFGRTSFIYNCDEVFGEPKRDFLHWEAEDINHNLGERINKVITQPNQRLLLHLIRRFLILIVVAIASCADHFVQGHQRIHSLK